MKQVWRRQQIERRREAGLKKWWEEDEEDGQQHHGGQAQGKNNGTVYGHGIANGSWGGSGGSGVKLEIGGRKVSIDALTPEEAAEMSPEEYTKFYNLAVNTFSADR